MPMLQPWCLARMPDGSVVKQLLFAEVQVGQGGWQAALHVAWDRAVAGLSPILMSRVAGLGW
eukprot:365375-Chlamydomonas_euryale.AAC.4